MNNRQNIVAVFEQIQPDENECNEGENSFRISEPNQGSECDLVIDEGDSLDTSKQPPKKKAKLVYSHLPLNLTCTWKSCSETFRNYKEFLEHIQEHAVHKRDAVKVGNYGCEFYNCKCECPTFESLIKHVAFHAYHEKLKYLGEVVVKKSDLPKCTQTEHFDIPVITNDYGCNWDYCTGRFMLIQEFLDHVQEHVYQYFKDEKHCKGKRTKTKQCLWLGCGMKFHYRWKLLDHTRSHTKDKSFACPTCGTFFATKLKLVDHRNRQIPVEIANYQCSECSKIYPTERLLKDHMRGHINHFKCTMCEMTCHSPYDLAKHVRFRHLNERPFKCNLCEHAFVTRTNLDQHLSTHCDEKLKCDECDYTCRAAYSMERHYLKQHGPGLPTYECHCCFNHFNDGSSLTRHLIKKHQFRWPSGHSRFRYKEEMDGKFRLQTVRYESLEVTREMMAYKPPITNNQEYELQESTDSTDRLRKFEIKVQPPTQGVKRKLKIESESDYECDDLQPVQRDEIEGNTPTPSEEKNIIITIEDVDECGKVIKSETVESREIYSMDELENAFVWQHKSQEEAG